MRFELLHEIPCRIRLRVNIPKSLDVNSSNMNGVLAGIPGIDKIEFRPYTRSVIIHYDGEKGTRDKLFNTLQQCSLSRFINQRIRQLGQAPATENNALQTKKSIVVSRIVTWIIRPIIPLPIQTYLFIKRTYTVVRKGIIALSRQQINADVLDSAAVSVAIAMRDIPTANTITFLLQVGDYLEEWTKQKSKESLSGLFSDQNEWAWILKNETEIRIPIQDIVSGDIVVAREGHKIPVDGVVQKGEAMVSQACITGEAMPVRKYDSVTVYAGTVVTEGKLLIEAVKVAGNTRVSQMIKIIEESEDLKASLQSKAEQLADRIVPYSFLLSGLTWLATGSVYKAASTLLVDYSCAIKLSTPLSLMSAMIAASKHGVLIKGGKFIEQMASVDSFVLDKTGTLTEAKPEVVDVIPFNGFKRDFLLRNVACVEEHFPHPVASAVVRKALEEGLDHDEKHSEVNYIVAHGIASHVNGQEILVGSHHFIHEDKGISVDFSKNEVQRYLQEGRSLLYIAIGGKLAGIIVIEDPTRKDAGPFIQALKNIGIQKIVMLTGDNAAAAEKVANELNITSYFSQVFPEDKTKIIRELKESGHRVAMVGDGMNDTPALASADVGISMGHGADIAKEVCDVLLLQTDLNNIIYIRQLSQKTLRRIKQNYLAIVGINSVLIGMGIMGMIPPIMSALVHNATTIVVAGNSLRKV